jgi:hypothetical protein
MFEIVAATVTWNCVIVVSPPKGRFVEGTHYYRCDTWQEHDGKFSEIESDLAETYLIGRGTALFDVKEAPFATLEECEALVKQKRREWVATH